MSERGSHYSGLTPREHEVRSGLLLLASALAVIALIVGAACSTGDDAATPTPTATSSASAAPPTRTAAPAPSFPEISVGEPIEIPENIALIVETGCTSCDAPPESLIRVYMRPDGTLSQDILFNVSMLNDLPESETDFEPYITTWGTRPDASEIIVVVCVIDGCGDLSPADHGGKVWAYRSADGGITWQEWPDWPIEVRIIGFVDSGVIGIRQTNPLDPTGPPPPRGYEPLWEHVLLPDGIVIAPPEDASVATEPNFISLPHVTDAGQILWPDDEARLLTSEGNVVATLPEGAESVSAVAGDPLSGLLVWWRPSGIDSPIFITRYDKSATGRNLVGLGTRRSSWTMLSGAWHPETNKLYANVHFSETSLPAPNMFIELIPAVFDLDSWTASPITSPFLAGFIEVNSRNRVVAVQHGALARVVNTDGSCLSVRTEPGLLAPVVECVAEGVLLRLLDKTVPDVEGLDWRGVITPSGEQGVVATDYIEY